MANGLGPDPSWIGLLNVLVDHHSFLYLFSPACPVSLLQQDPAHEEAMVYKAQVLMEDNQAPKAISALKMFLKKSPGSAVVWYYLGISLRVNGNGCYRLH